MQKMQKLYAPSQLAELLKVSTTTLRRYEDLGLIPDVPRTESGRRGYAELHRQAFQTIRALLKAGSIPLAYETMRLLKQGRGGQALWGVNRQQADIQAEKERVESLLVWIRSAESDPPERADRKKGRTIGEAAELAGVRPSAIRHWEKEGLIASERNPANGYRLFSNRQLRRILVISSLRQSVYSIDNMKKLLDELDGRQLSSVEASFELALEKLNGQLERQFQAIAELMAYRKQLIKASLE
ncbi:MerR family DNA-binding transcriptional regulator [Paenibacillus pasadenensis]|uniref:Transcriptional regulator, MerR family n=1 Tax=Paenibacillus pasadenensis TaxID=217090 RepID=A0A2N5NA13_9BACL|nr:MerR family DNA-binding transcriptional regulator [Paenibacillus pasadenensis]PLT47148.1 Transcriptional regulator, MerR family [Paenibacillus pasadenensis]